jgi:3-hydroxyisobutyrate dehydrogenase-like beta-hydroxyacid dehydrogenase
MSSFRMGLNPQVLLDVLNNSSARSWSTEVYCPVPGLVPTAPSSRNYDGGFKNELMVKVRRVDFKHTIYALSRMGSRITLEVSPIS